MTSEKYPFIIGLMITYLLLLLACAPVTSNMVREMGPEFKYSFTAPENYQPIYRKVLEQVRNCYQASGLAWQMVVQGDIYHDIKSGMITTAMHDSVRFRTFQVIDISAIGEKETNIAIHYSFNPVEKYGQVVKAWVLENSKDCYPKEE